MLEAHCIVLAPKATWKLTRSTPGGAPENVIRLKFSTASFASISERDAYETIRAVLRHENVAWVEPSAQEWRLDLQGLAAVIGQPDIVPWLKGTVTLKPEFKSEILAAGTRKVVDAEFVFYITPDTLAAETMPKRQDVFISYSHADKKWLERVRVHLRPLEKRGLLELFDDSKIKPGSRWREEIRAALDRAKVAILLVRADFIASDFISENELPPLLKRAKDGGATILPVIVSPCGFRREENLSCFQSVNDPSRPLEGLTHSESEQVLVDLADAVGNALAERVEVKDPKASADSHPASGEENVPYGIPVPGKPYLVETPFAPGKFVDVEGFFPGTKVKDPYTGRVFKVPEKRSQ